MYDVVEEDGHPWIVMELLAPRTLDDVLAERRLSPEEAATVGLRVLAALQAADAAGVLHRDVKPGNVMFRGDGDDMAQAVLTDFGIARFVGDPSATTTGTVVGSPAYVAPERARGEPAALASDLWSLGITLWTAVEGVSPFQRDGALPTLTAIVTEDVPAAAYAGALGPVLEGILRKDPQERLSVLQLERELGAVAAGHAAPVAYVPDSTAVLDVIDDETAADRPPPRSTVPSPVPSRCPPPALPRAPTVTVDGAAADLTTPGRCRPGRGSGACGRARARPGAGPA